MIWEWALRVMVLVLGVGAVLAVFRVRTAAVRHLAWTGVMLAMLVLPAWVVWGPKVPVPVQADLPALSMPELLPEASLAPPSGLTAVPAFLPNEPEPAPLDWRMIAISVYFLVACLMLARLIQATLWTRRIAAVSAPITVGWFRPVMLLPQQWAEWPEGQREAVVLHEQEHVRRRDPLIRWLSLLNRALFWFHPLAWWLERKLATLAEEACDAAVLARGHAPADYARYLIDVARSVEQAGGRVRLHLTFGEADALSKRIRRILRDAPAPSLSRWRSIAVVVLGGVVLVVSAACTLDRRERPTEGQPSMAELRNKRSQKSQELEAKEKTLREEVRTMTPEQAREIEARLKANPNDPATYRKMVLYYQRVVDVASMDALALWYIEHQPDTSVFPGRINPEWDRAGYERGKALWLANLKKPGASAQLYNRAAMFLQAGDLPLAEQVLLDGQKAFPREVGSEFGRVYALALLGAVGGVNGSPRSVSMQEAHGPYARSVLAKLLNASENPVRLTMTAQNLMLWGARLAMGKQNPLDFDPLTLAKSLNDRALSLEPHSSAALRQRVDIEDIAASVRLRNIPRDQMSDADRMLSLRRGMEFSEPRNGEPEARELVALATRLPENPESANALFFGNLALGRIALKRGDRSEAVRYLKAAASAAPTDRLRYKEIDTTLARELVDMGERTAVAEFMESCAQFNQLPFQPFAKWAAEIRQGINPDF